MKILTQEEFLGHFDIPAELDVPSTAPRLQYSTSGSRHEKGEMAYTLAESLGPILPVFAFIDPRYVRKHVENSDLLSVWREFGNEYRSLEDAPYYIFDSESDRIAMYFVLSLSLQSVWRLAVWSLDRATSIVATHTGCLRVASEMPGWLKQFDERWLKAFHHLPLDPDFCYTKCLA